MASTSWSTASFTGTKDAPSYTSVNARKTLARPEPVPPPKTVKIDWPDPVRDYVNRAFATDQIPPGISKEEVSAKLKSVITAAAESNQLEKIDWHNHPLPYQIVLQERAAAMEASSLAQLAMMSRKSPASKKRKSTSADMTEDSTDVPPWRQLAGASLADRMSYPDRSADKRQKKADQFRAGATPSKLTDLEKRRQRFELGKSGGASPYHSSPRDDSPMPNANGHVVGTCKILEKNYFRLTAPPKPETVRPLPVLQEALSLIIEKWKEHHNYGYVCDQFKSMRQDLTVQHIKNEFTVRVYESHARIALEKGDIGEYNQCQTQLRQLYKRRLEGNPGEFTAYRILYFIYTCNRTGMNDCLADLTLQDKQHPEIQHALETRAALATGNYHKFFRLYNQAPNMGAYLIDMFADRERLAALVTICRAYKPEVKVSFLTEELGFTDDQQCAQFLCDYGGQTLLEDRRDGEGVRFLAGKAGTIYDHAKQQAFRGVDIKGQI